jgi:hypothetical protein
MKPYYFAASAALFLLVFFFVASCSKKKMKSSRSVNVCSELVTVFDKKGLDGCKWILMTDAGATLEPAEIDVEHHEFSHMQRLKVSYEALPRKSVCQMGKPVRIHCLTYVGWPCVESGDLKDIEWLTAAANYLGAKKTTRLKEGDQVFYTISNYQFTELYDCKGQFICKSEGKAMTDCLRRIQKMVE